VEPALDNIAPWSLRDTWLGIALMAVIIGLLAAALVLLGGGQVNDWALLLVELIYLIPVLVFMAVRRAGLRSLGFVKFEWSTLGIGCGLLIAAYAAILIHNTILILLGVRTQGALVNELIQNTDAVWVILSAAVLAPLVEEVFFRGFVFTGFRQKYGWIRALLISSGVFAVAHLDPASLIPTFLLGCVLAYVYQRSNSIWPGILLHFLINSFALCVTFAALKYSAAFP
jgi:membrane protease YdiL (CAAX protease family)